MKHVRRALALLSLKRATKFYSIAHSMYKGPKFIELGVHSRGENLKVKHIFDDRYHERESHERKVYSISDSYLSTETGHVYWEGKLVSESSSWPPERANLMTEAPRRPPSIKHLTGRFIPMPSSPYYHWLIEDLPAVLAAKIKAPDAFLIVSPKRPRYVSDFLEASDVDFLEIGEVISGDEFVFTNKQSIIGTPQRSDIKLLEGLHKALQGQTEFLSRKIYISRGSATRSPSWESKLENVLESQGFEILRLEKINWTDQLAIFSHADVIVGIHGAGIANCVFSKPGARLIELMDSLYPNVCFEILANQKSLDYSRIIFNGHEANLRDPIDKVLSLINS